MLRTALTALDSWGEKSDYSRPKRESKQSKQSLSALSPMMFDGRWALVSASVAKGSRAEKSENRKKTKRTEGWKKDRSFEHLNELLWLKNKYWQSFSHNEGPCEHDGHYKSLPPVQQPSLAGDAGAASCTDCTGLVTQEEETVEAGPKPSENQTGRNEDVDQQNIGVCTCSRNWKKKFQTIWHSTWHHKGHIGPRKMGRGQQITELFTEWPSHKLGEGLLAAVPRIDCTVDKGIVKVGNTWHLLLSPQTQLHNMSQLHAELAYYALHMHKFHKFHKLQSFVPSNFAQWKKNLGTSVSTFMIQHVEKEPFKQS